MEKPGSAIMTVPPWNSAHDSRACSQELLRATGGDGLFYCFVAQ